MDSSQPQRNRTEAIIKDMLGAQALTIASLRAQLEEARERIQQLEYSMAATAKAPLHAVPVPEKAKEA